MKHHFTNQSTKVLSTQAQNKINGKALERHFAALLGTALEARVSFTPRSEDDAKVDLVAIT